MDLIIKSNPGITGVQNVIGIFALILIFTQLSTVIPILLFFTRRQFYNLFYSPGHRIAKWQFHTFNLASNIIFLIAQLMAFNINIIISITGAFGGFFLCYIIPIYLHLKCIYYPKKQETIEQRIEDMGSTGENASSDLINKVKDDSLTGCVDHTKYMKDNKTLIFAYYGFLIVCGFAILAVQFLKLFSG